MKIIKVALRKVGKNSLDIIFEHNRWYAFKVNYRALFYIVFALLSAFVIQQIMTVNHSGRPQPQKIIEQSVYRV